jgi:hypothetical protein
VDTNLGWKGSEKYVAGIPQVFDFWQGPQERYDILMNNFTEQTWMAVVMQQELTKVMTSCVRYPPHKMQSYSYTGPITLSVPVDRRSTRKGRSPCRAANRQLAPPECEITPVTRFE